MAPHNAYIFFFNDTATTEIYTLPLHDALPISVDHRAAAGLAASGDDAGARGRVVADAARPDRKSTRLNSSHQIISYAVFCLKKKKDIESQFRVFNSSAWAR